MLIRFAINSKNCAPHGEFGREARAGDVAPTFMSAPRALAVFVAQCPYLDPAVFGLVAEKHRSVIKRTLHCKVVISCFLGKVFDYPSPGAADRPLPQGGLSFTHISGWTWGVDMKSLLCSGLRRASYQGTALAVPREAGS